MGIHYNSLKNVFSPLCPFWLRPTLIKINETNVQHASEPPPVVLYNSTTVLGEDYVGRLIVSEKQVTLHSVRMLDEGSFTVLDRGGHVKMRNCLNVKGEQASERSIVMERSFIIPAESKKRAESR